MTYWLSVEGDGSWSFAGKKFSGVGPHEVDSDTATAAQASRYPWLVVAISDGPPGVSEPVPLSGMLTPADFDFSPPPPPVAVPVATDTPPDPFADPATGRVPCPLGCGKDYASGPALERHLKVIHGEGA